MIPQLKTFYVYLTSSCNCACRHCWIVPASTGPPIWLTPSLLRHAITAALPLGLQTLKWTGGEPTLHPHFPALLALQKEFGLAASLETNGMLVDARLADEMRAAGVGNVSVSLDGAQATTHDSIRGVSGGFERTCAGIRTLVMAGYHPELIFTLQQGNVEELDDYLTLAGQLGAGAVKLNVLQPLLRGAGLTASGESLSVSRILALASRLEHGPSSGVPVILDVPMAFRPLGALLAGTAGGVCDIAHILGLLPTAEYALCGIGRHVPELVMGRVADVALERLWRDDPLLNRLRLGLPTELQGICRDCLMKGICRGSCVAANYAESANLFASHWFCRQAAAEGLFPASRRSGLNAGN